MRELLSTLASPTVLWILLAVVFGAWLVLSWVLRYHWKTYSAHSTSAKRASKIYFGVSLIILITVATLIISL